VSLQRAVCIHISKILLNHEKEGASCCGGWLCVLGLSFKMAARHSTLTRGATEFSSGIFRDFPQRGSKPRHSGSATGKIRESA
jgi:hypothetical protein